MGLLRRTGSNIAWIVLSDILAKGATVFATVYLARILGVAEFGIYSLGIAIVTVIWPAVDLGVNGYGTREVARDNARAQELASLLNSMRLAVSVAAVALAAAVVVAMDLPATKEWAILAALLYLVTFAVCPDWVARGLEEMPVLFYINIATSAVFIVANIVLVSSPEDTVVASLVRSLSFAAGSIVGILLLYRSRKIRFRITIDVGQWYETIRKTYSFCINRLTENLSRYLPLYLIALLLSDSALGLFSAPHRLYIIALGVLSAFTAAIYPILSDLHANNAQHFTDYQRQLVRMTLFVFVPIALVGWVNAGDLVTAIFGAEYSGSAHALSLMLFCLPVIGAKMVYIFALLSSNHENPALKATLAGTLIQALLGFFLIPLYGVTGAGISMIAGELLGLALVIRICRLQLASHGPLDGYLLKILGISAAVAYGSSILGLGIILTLMISVMSYTLLSIVFGVVPLSLLRKMIRRSA